MRDAADVDALRDQQPERGVHRVVAQGELATSSSFVVYIPRALDNFCFNLFVVDTDNLESRNSVWRKLHPFTESDREVSSLCVKGGAAQSDDAAKSIYSVDCAKEEIDAEGVCTKEATWQAKPLTMESTFSKLKAKATFGMFDKKEYSTTGVDVELKVRITQRNAKAMAKAGASVAAGNLRDSCAINRIAPPTEGEAADTSGGVESPITDVSRRDPIPDAIPDSEFQLKVEASFSLPEAGALTAVKPLATCSKVEKGSPACPKLTKDDANGKWVVQEERGEPPETDARNGDRAEPRGLTLQEGSSWQDVRLMDMSVGDGWWSGTSSYKVAWEDGTVVTAAGPLITLRPRQAVRLGSDARPFDLYQINPTGVRHNHLFYRITNLRQREMSDADTMKQKSIDASLKALYLPTGYLTLEDAMKDTTFREERAPFWRDCAEVNCKLDGDSCKKKSSGGVFGMGKKTYSFETEDGPLTNYNTNKLCCCKDFNPSAPTTPGATPGADKIAGDGLTGFFEANLLMGKTEVTAAGTIGDDGRPAQEMCTMRLSFENKRQTPSTGWAKGAHEMWLANRCRGCERTAAIDSTSSSANSCTTRSARASPMRSAEVPRVSWSRRTASSASHGPRRAPGGTRTRRRSTSASTRSATRRRTRWRSRIRRSRR